MHGRVSKYDGKYHIQIFHNKTFTILWMKKTQRVINSDKDNYDVTHIYDDVIQCQ